MKARTIQRATVEDLRRLDAAEQWAAELDETATVNPKARAAKAESKPAHKAAKTVQKLKAKARNRSKL